MTLDYTAIAKSKPDVIFALLGTEEGTVRKARRDRTGSWSNQAELHLQLAGSHRGRRSGCWAEDQAQTLIKKVEGDLAKVGEDNPVLKDTTFIAADLSAPDTAYVYSEGDTCPRLTALGMNQADYVQKNATKDTFFFHRLKKSTSGIQDIVFSSAIAGNTTKDIVKSQPLYGQIPAVKSDAVALL